MIQKELSEIFLALAHGRRSYGGFVRIDNFDGQKILEGQRLIKLQAESAIESVKGLDKSKILPKVTYITLQNEDEALAAWFFAEGDKHGAGSIRKL